MKIKVNGKGIGVEQSEYIVTNILTNPKVSFYL